jgi:phosphatidylserine decarboxylase
MKEELLLRFLYRTVPGRAVLKLLVTPRVSRVGGRFLNSGLSRPLIPYYIAKHRIDMRGIEIPEGGFCSFNAFFTRKRKNHRKSGRPDCLFAPCDGLLSWISVKRGTVFDIKHTAFTLESLLQDEVLAEEFAEGIAFIFRLTPANYHRYSYASDGRILTVRKIPGVFHCVRPVAVRTLPVYAENSREYQVIDTDRFGRLIQMEVGALLVGKITNDANREEGSIVWCGDEKGYFEFGGSTILLILKGGVIEPDESLTKRMDANGEVPVRMGEEVAHISAQRAQGALCSTIRNLRQPSTNTL